MKTYKVTVDDYGHIRWFNKQDQLHRVDGPAVEFKNGNKYWYINGQLHREDGPAIEYKDGTKWWYKNSLCHREDGPASEYSNGDKYWWLNDKEYTKEEWEKEIARLKGPSQEEIDKALEVLSKVTGYKITKA